MARSFTPVRSGRARFWFLAAFLFGCGEGIPGVHPPTNAIIEDVFNFTNGALGGYVDTPKYPIGVPNTFYDTTYAAVVTASSPSKDPLGFLEIIFFPGEGPLPQGCGVADCVNGYDHVFVQWQNDAQGFKIAFPSGNYIVARGGFAAPKQDYMDVYGKFWYLGSSYNFLGEAVLPWRAVSSTSSITGSSNAVFPGEMFWVQAYAQLPQPITYSWSLDDEPQSWNSSFITTGLTANGNHTIVATLTGANQSQVQLVWNVWVMCPPPADPYAFYCP